MIIKRVTSAIATASLLFYALTPAAFAQTTTFEISGNGSDSENEIEVETTQTVTVVQDNNADIDNHINADANTGDNEAEDNTGGDVSIETGDAETTVDVSNKANANVANVQNCGTCAGDTAVTISGNGSDSENEVEIDNTNEIGVYQTNYADINNRIYADADTGDNEAEDNTGGDVSIETGDATTSVEVRNHANANVANVGSGNDENGEVSLMIIGNGSDSENEIELDLERSITLVQDNNADIDNHINADADTGDNEAEDNTGGDVSIETGDAETTVMVDNMANFNWANVDCCLFDILAKISGNGSDSENEIEAEIASALEVFQDNCGENNIGAFSSNGYQKCGIDNDIDADSDTGDNDAEDNTGPVNDDPVEISTGDATSDTEVSNSANLNVFSQGGLETPDGIDFDFDFDFDFDLSDLLSMLQGLIT